MSLLKTAYILKGRDMVTTDKTLIKNANDDEFEEVTLILSQEEVDRYSKELKILAEYEEERLEHEGNSPPL
jgi:hypothetical protein